MSEKALSAFKRDPRKFFEVDFLRIRECENRRVLANISTVLPDSDEDCVPQRHSRRAFWLIYYVSTTRTSPLFVPSRVALFRQSHPGPCYSPRINLVAWRGQISFLMLISRCSFRSLWRSWKEIIKTIRKFVCKYECRYSVCWINILSKKNGDRFSLLTHNFVGDVYENVCTKMMNISILKSISLYSKRLT